MSLFDIFKKKEVPLGKAGEDFACEYLADNGYKIIKRNYRVGHLEADIICESKTHIAFVEVKSRTDSASALSRGRPGAAVRSDKRANIRNCARAYLKSYKGGKIPRMDVIEVYLTKDEKGKTELSDKGIVHIENAF